MSDEAQRLDSVLERLSRLESERDIVHALHAYGHALDYGDEALFLDCFVEAATLAWPHVTVVGHEELRAAFRQHSHIPDKFHKHVMVEPLITFVDEVATVDSMFIRLDVYGGVPHIRTFGRYRDTFTRCDDGRWRIAERLCEAEAVRDEPID